MTKPNSAFTLLEIIITMVIMISIVLMGVFTLSSYLPRQRLLDSVETVEQILSRAQLEATSRSTWSCIKYNIATKTLEVYMDTNNTHLTVASTTACGDGDPLITSQQLREGVKLATCGFFNFTPLWFDSAGVPKNCMTPGNCIAFTAQVIVSSTKLHTKNCAREVEAVSSGMIAIIPRGEKGYEPSLWAPTPELLGGCEDSCITP